MYQITKDLIEKKIKANEPSTLEDVRYMVEAVSPSLEE
jgi:hypothetical protein